MKKKLIDPEKVIILGDNTKEIVGSIYRNILSNGKASIEKDKLFGLAIDKEKQKIEEIAFYLADLFCWKYDIENDLITFWVEKKV